MTDDFHGRAFYAPGYVYDSIFGGSYTGGIPIVRLTDREWEFLRNQDLILDTQCDGLWYEGCDNER